MLEKASYEALKERIAELEQKALILKKKEEALRYHLDFKALIVSISSSFINLELNKIDFGIHSALQRIAEFVQADRSYVFRFNNATGTMDNTHEWCAPGITSHISSLKNIPLTWNPWLISQINTAKVVHIPDVEALPPEADTLKKECRIENIKSMLLVPTEFAGAVIGFLGLDSVRACRKWPDDVIALLNNSGEIIANALERKHTEEILRQSEEKYRTILEAVEESYWEVDLGGNFTFFSPSLSKLLGYSQTELMGMNYRKYVSTEVSKKIYRSFKTVYDTGKRVNVTDFEHITKDGECIIVEMSIALIRDLEDRPIGFRGVSRDMTYRRATEKALIESERRYRTALEANPDPIIVYDIKGNIIYFNPAFTKVFGWPLEEWIGKKMTNFVPEQTIPETKQMNSLVLAGKNFSGIETKRFTKEGDIISVSISGAVYKDLCGNPMGSVITIRDIRDRKKMETQLLNFHKMESLGTLAGGIAHDFNNLLMSIQGNLSLILFDLDQTHPHFELLQKIEKNIESGSKLTAQLLGFSRKGDFELKPIDLNQLVSTVSETFGRTRKEISILLDFAADLAVIEADEGRIEQVLLNLLVNAGHAMPTGGEIRLKTKNIGYDEIVGTLYQPKPGNYVKLSVTDTGCGMSKEVLAHVFEPFFTTKEAGKGTGLGLASAYGIIKGHGGYIDVESDVGRGTTFLIYLPASEKSLPQADEEKNDKMISGKETLLLVDDEEMILDVSAKMLTIIGYHVLTACDGKEAIEIFKEKHKEIDLVILDVIMPNMSGAVVFDHLKQINPNAKVLLLSGYSSDGQVAQILSRGCDGFIQKPFNIKTISAKIREIMA